MPKTFKWCSSLNYYGASNIIALSSIVAAISRFKIFGLLALGIHLLRSLQFFVVRNDKSNGIALVAKNQLKEYFELTVPAPIYHPMAFSSVDSEALGGTLKSLAVRIGKFEEDWWWTRAIMHYCERPFTCMVTSKLKSHKAQGAIVPRSIHQSLGTRFVGLSRWLALKLKPHLDQVPHLCKDSMAMRSALVGTPLSSQSKFCCIDVKDFYLSGSITDLDDALKKTFSDNALANLFSDVLTFVLDSQFVTIRMSSALYKCVIGAGIGLEHSAAIANYAFYCVCEKPFLESADAVGITKYSRYHDDICLIAETIAAWRLAWAALKKFRRFFTLEVRQISSVSVNILDLTLSNVDDIASVEPTLIKLPLPLCPTSCHSPATHRAWPGAVTKRVLSLSSDSGNAITRLANLYSRVPCHPIVMDRLQTYEAPPQAPVQTPSNVQRVACVMKFHPVLFKAWKCACRVVPIPESLSLVAVNGWANGVPSVENFISAHNINFCKGKRYLCIRDDSGGADF